MVGEQRFVVATAEDHVGIDDNDAAIRAGDFRKFGHVRRLDSGRGKIKIDGCMKLRQALASSPSWR